jgi:hypothetical protein
MQRASTNARLPYSGFHLSVRASSSTRARMSHARRARGWPLWTRDITTIMYLAQLSPLSVSGTLLFQARDCRHGSQSLFRPFIWRQRACPRGNSRPSASRANKGSPQVLPLSPFLLHLHSFHSLSRLALTFCRYLSNGRVAWSSQACPTPE